MRVENQEWVTVKMNGSQVSPSRAAHSTAIAAHCTLEYWHLPRSIHRVIHNGIRFCWLALCALKSASLNAIPGWLAV
ncbi:hypothetical protein C7431_101847 [Pantoea allii]|uniref:Uncharacterized protein n=1 Tax=Pantoea allii TaxID=574096 RepID=A0A2V2BHA3_9GAMM|nr:hypothetical protein C7431_101847 [Pantoea allii]